MKERKSFGMVAVALLAALWPQCAVAQQEAANENDLRAAFILNFARFINWPGERPDNLAPLVIGVWGDDEFAAVLTRAVNGQTVRGRPLQVRICRDPRQASEVNIIYVASARQKQLSQWLAENLDAAILTISDHRDFCKSGGTIALFAEGRRIRFEINQESLLRRGLHASSKLLVLSKSGGGGSQ
jgi:hypothetical protein